MQDLQFPQRVSVPPRHVSIRTAVFEQFQFDDFACVLALILHYLVYPPYPDSNRWK